MCRWKEIRGLKIKFQEWLPSFIGKNQKRIKQIFYSSIYGRVLASAFFRGNRNESLRKVEAVVGVIKMWMKDYSYRRAYGGYNMNK